MKGHIHSLESFGTVDGPGVRYVVFFQGCPMRCQYCHNPDTWPAGQGQEMDVNEIISAFERNRTFYTTGGITATGGEPLLQLPFLTELFEEAHKREIHTCLDTSGITFQPENPDYVEKMNRLMDVTDYVMLDLKHIQEDAHKELTAQSNKNILAFARYLDQRGLPFRVRHVIVPEITYKRESLLALGEFLGTLNHLDFVEVLPYHSMGEVKYESLGMDYPLKGTPQLSKDDAKKALTIIEEGIRHTKKS